MSYLSWPIGPLVYEPKCRGGGGCVAGSQPMRTSEHISWLGAKIHVGDLAPYLTYGRNCPETVLKTANSLVFMPYSFSQVVIIILMSNTLLSSASDHIQKFLKLLIWLVAGPCVRDPCLNLQCPENQMCLPSFDLASARCVCKGPCPADSVGVYLKKKDYLKRI